MPAPRATTADERAELVESLATRFGARTSDKLEVRAAGPFRFAGDDQVLFIERSDLRSVIFERASYGRAGEALDAKLSSKEILLPQLEKVTRQAYPMTERPQFAAFQDEFAGAVPIKEGGTPVDPHKASIHVARTASYTRIIDRVPIFGSEMLVGLDRDGGIGRLRIHWPSIDPRLVREAHSLQRSVESKTWRLPKELQQPDTEILEVQAGVGHSSMADPEFRSAAVVRVLFRRTVKGTDHPISTTAYEYFGADGQEVSFSAFPQLRGNDAKEKARERPPAVEP